MPLFPDIDLENYLRRMVNFPEVCEEDSERQAQLAAASLQTEKVDNAPQPKETEKEKGKESKDESEQSPEEGKEETKNE